MQFFPRAKETLLAQLYQFPCLKKLIWPMPTKRLLTPWSTWKYEANWADCTCPLNKGTMLLTNQSWLWCEISCWNWNLLNNIFTDHLNIMFQLGWYGYNGSSFRHSTWKKMLKCSGNHIEVFYKWQCKIFNFNHSLYWSEG